jgi:hypothetical protein
VVRISVVLTEEPPVTEWQSRHGVSGGPWRSWRGTTPAAKPRWRSRSTQGAFLVREAALIAGMCNRGPV